MMDARNQKFPRYFVVQLLEALPDGNIQDRLIRRVRLTTKILPVPPTFRNSLHQKECTTVLYRIRDYTRANVFVMVDAKTWSTVSPNMYGHGQYPFPPGSIFRPDERTCRAFRI